MFVCFSRVIAAIFAVNGEVNECPVLASLTGDVDTIIQIIEEIGADDKVMFKVVIDDSDAYKRGFSLKFLVHGLDLQVLSWMHAKNISQSMLKMNLKDRTSHEML